MFKFAGKDDKLASPVGTLPAPPIPSDHVDRRELLHRISNFLLDHGLDVTPGNLALAQAIVSGDDVALIRQIDARLLAQEPITQAWLDSLASQATRDSDTSGEPERREELHWLISKLDRSLVQFSQNVRAASIAASDYHAALAETAINLDAVRPVVELTGLTQLTSAMIERSRAVEIEMHRCEGEAISLQQSLRFAPAGGMVEHSTGPGSQRAFAAALERAVQAAHQAIEPLSVAFCDIDGFQSINDKYGQDTGNRVRQAITRVLQRISGQNCHVAHHGDEDFVLLFRGLSPDEAGLELNNAREDFAQRKLIDRTTHASLGSVTFSGGVADVFAYDTPGSALRAADEALSEAKVQGRNRIVVARARPVSQAPSG